jgi:hypothetical protein
VDPVDAARSLVEERYPECLAAFAGGSLMRGEGTSTSDIDLLVVTTRQDAPFRESLIAFDWPVEAFVHTQASCLDFFQRDARSRSPILPTICAEGATLRDVDGVADRLRREAQAVLKRGPTPLTQSELDHRRYLLTDLLDDLIGSTDADESAFIAHDLAVQATNLILACQGQWEGKGKWLLRNLRRVNPDLARALTVSLRLLCLLDRKDALIAYAEGALAQAGGRLWEGYFARPENAPPAPPGG